MSEKGKPVTIPISEETMNRTVAEVLANPPKFPDITTSDHTPGPWRAVEQTARDGTSLGWIIEHVNGRIGWSCYATLAPNVGEPAPFPIGAANARLIAAAPDLLEAIVDLVEQLKKGSFLNEHGDAMGLFAMEQVYAAIAKAKGRS